MGEIGPSEGTELRAPEHVASENDASDFRCGDAGLDEWLRQRALRNEADGGSRTYVVCAGRRIVGFYCLANGGIAHRDAIGAVRRNMPDPIPVMILGRLAVDERWQGKGIGRAMLRDAILRIIQAAEIAGIRAILVHAKSADAKAFYERWGFRSTELAPLTLMVTVKEAAKILGR